MWKLTICRQKVDNRLTMPNLSDVNLNRLAIFVAVGDANSFTGAAEKLGLAKTMVSKHMQLLEAELGVALLARSTRKTCLTEAGRTFYAASRELLQAAEAAIECVRCDSGAAHGKLRVTAPNDYGVQVVAPVLTALRRQHPALQVELVCGDHLADLISENFDVAVRLGHLNDSSHRAARVGSFSKGLVASPAFVAAHGMPADVEALERYPFIAHTVLPHPAMFTLHKPGNECRTVNMGRIVFASNTASACRAAVLAGDGVAYMTDFAVHNDVMDGTLVRLFPGWVAPDAPIHVLYPNGVQVPLKVRLFIDGLKAVYATSQDQANPICRNAGA